MAEPTTYDLLGTQIDSAETKFFNVSTINSFQATGPNGEIIFDSTQQTLPGFIADTASLAFTASTAPLYLPLIGGTITGNLTVNGTTTLNNVISVTSSYSSGSTIFGDTTSDTHRFTGSVFITGSSVTWNNSTLIASNVTSSMSVASASQALTASYFNGSVTSASYASTASLALNVSASSIDSNTSETYDGSNNISINWGSRRLQDGSGTISVSWEDRTLSNNSAAVTLDWGTEILYDSVGTSSIDWERRKLRDPSDNDSINYEDRFLIDSGGTTSINYENRWAISHDGNIGIDYENRQLLANDGGTVALDWSTPNANTMSGSLTVGRITSTPSNENTLNIYPAPAGGTGEGGQILLAASGGIYTSASMLDTWQDQFRVLRGSNTGGSNAGLMYMNLQSGNTQFVGAVTASAYSGLPNDYLYVTRNTSQTVGSSWANTDIIFNNLVVSKGISYNTGTGLASLTGGKVYRITARLAWAAAAVYNLQYSCYTSANTQIGPTVEIIQSTNGTNNISDGTLEFIYAPGSNTDIKIRTTSANNALSGESIRGDLNTQLIIQQIA